MDFSRLFNMSNSFVRGALHVQAGVDLDDIAIFCGDERPEKPIIFRHESGGKPRDLISTTYVTLKLYSDRVIEILKDHGFSGWKTYPVEVYGKKGVRIDGYHGLAVTGRCGEIDWSRGRKERRPAPVPGGSAYDVWIGMYFDPETWDGSDLFVPEGMTCTIVTEAVKDALTAAKVSNISMRPLTQFERDWRV